jgi:hypothetical protein
VRRRAVQDDPADKSGGGSDGGAAGEPVRPTARWQASVIHIANRFDSAGG